MPDDPREVAAEWKRETDALNAKITALTAVMDAARIHLATHPVFRSKFIGDAGSEARSRQNDQIISEDNLRAAIAAANF